MRPTVSVQDLQLRDVGFLAVCIVSVAAILLAQFVSLVVIDTTGLDAVLPGVMIYAIIPAALLTLLPAGLALKLYGQTRGLWYGAAVFAALIVASLVTVNFLLLG